MVRRKVEMKRIENTSSRHVAFSKRRKGLLKKARDLSVLCDADVAVIVFSAPGRLYDFCTANSFPGLVERYRDSVDEKSLQNICKAQDNGDYRIANVKKCEELQQVLDWNLEEYINRMSTTELTLLQEELNHLLKETSSRKTKLQLQSIEALHEKEKLMLEEKLLLQKEIVEIKDKEGGGVEETGSQKGKGCRLDPPQQEDLITLNLFR